MQPQTAPAYLQGVALLLNVPPAILMPDDPHQLGLSAYQVAAVIRYHQQQRTGAAEVAARLRSVGNAQADAAATAAIMAPTVRQLALDRQKQAAQTAAFYGISLPPELMANAVATPDCPPGYEPNGLGGCRQAGGGQGSSPSCPPGWTVDPSVPGGCRPPSVGVTSPPSSGPGTSLTSTGPPGGCPPGQVMTVNGCQPIGIGGTQPPATSPPAQPPPSGRIPGTVPIRLLDNPEPWVEYAARRASQLHEHSSRELS